MTIKEKIIRNQDCNLIKGKVLRKQITMIFNIKSKQVNIKLIKIIKVNMSNKTNKQNKK